VVQPLCIKLASASSPWAGGAAISLRPLPGALHLFDASGSTLGVL